MKKKIKDLTIGEIISTARKYCCNCTRCPLYQVPSIRCDRFYCDLNRESQVLIEQEIEEGIEVEEDVDYVTK